jgi:hypothetical protein
MALKFKRGQTVYTYGVGGTTVWVESGVVEKSIVDSATRKSYVIHTDHGKTVCLDEEQLYATVEEAFNAGKKRFIEALKEDYKEMEELVAYYQEKMAKCQRLLTAFERE